MIRMTKFIRTLVVFAVLFPSAALACSVSVPASAQAGSAFTATVNLGGAQYPANLVRVNWDGSESEILGTATHTGDNAITVTATNVLGTHYYRAYCNNGSVQTSAPITFTFAQPTAPKILILPSIGQSNGCGRGMGPFTDPYESAVNDARILQVGRFGASDLALVPVGYSEGGVKYDGLQCWTKAEGAIDMGSELSLARRIVANDLAAGWYVVIVPAAFGGSSINKWLDESPTADPPVYNDLLARVNHLKSIAAQWQIVAVTFKQGESDVNNGNPASVWEQGVQTLFARLRADLGTPTVPIIMSVPGTPAWHADDDYTALKIDYVRAIQDIAANDPYVGIVSSQNEVSDQEIGQCCGTVHKNADSQVRIESLRQYGAWINFANALQPRPAWKRSPQKRRKRK